jgi:hypothetical protein
MAPLTDSAATTETFTEEEKIAIKAQLDQLLANHYFSHSRRFPAFLRYIVNATLDGQGDLLKERTIGVEIFGKSADYDTALDPIVRVTAGEVRKRIAQYYQEPGHEQEPRLSLQPGSYVPQFHFPGTGSVTVETEAPDETEAAKSAAALLPAPASTRWRWIMASAVALILIAAGVGFLVWRHTPGSAFDEFWSPILSSPDPVLVCVADQTQYTAISLRDAQDPEKQITLKDNLTAVIIDDLSAVIQVAGVLQSSGKRYSLRGENATTLMDLRNGPSVIIGAYDNAWTLRMTRSLRYHFANDADMAHLWIVDSAAPDRSRWVVDRREQLATQNYVDYAIVARFTDDVTGRPTLIAAGIARGGTIAAGEFLVSPALLQAALRKRRSAKTKNVEVVLSTQIINGEPGTPNIEAVYYW